jgi:DNA repair exonuclease SbcCD nuclease subunit
MTMILTIGDPHVTVEEIPDCERLIDCVIQAGRDCRPDIILFLGDLFHTHALVRIEVMEFWRRSFKRLWEAFPEADIYAMVGNHDRSHDMSVKGCAIQATPLVHVVDEPIEARPGVWFAPWYPTAKDFLSALTPGDVLFCHQTFDGSKYENGFWAPDGIDPNLVPFQIVISGHIHTPQEFGRVWYPGAPRWRSATDANVERAIWAVKIEDGDVVSRKPYNTADFCRVLVHVMDVQGSIDVVIPDLIDSPRTSVRVDIHGSPEYIATAREYWDPRGARIATFPVLPAAPAVRESEGIAVALQKFVDNWQPRYGTPPEALKRLVQERIHV